MGRPIEVRLLLDESAGTIAGSIQAGGAPPDRFFGWMELTRHLESLRQQVTAEPEAGAPAPTDPA